MDERGKFVSGVQCFFNFLIYFLSDAENNSFSSEIKFLILGIFCWHLHETFCVWKDLDVCKQEIFQLPKIFETGLKIVQFHRSNFLDWTLKNVTPNKMLIHARWTNSNISKYINKIIHLSGTQELISWVYTIFYQDVDQCWNLFTDNYTFMHLL